MTKEVNKLISMCFDSLDQAVKLVSENPSLLNMRTGLGETPLHYLVVEDQIEAVKQLVKLGAEVNTISNVNGTPLSEAASLGYESMVLYLLKQGAEIEISGQNDPTLIEGIRSGNVEVVKLLLEYGANFDSTDSLGNTGLHVAADDDNRSEVLEYLIDKGADIEERALFRWTPLHTAAFYGCEKNVRKLLAAGADTNSSDKDGCTPFDLAESQNHKDVAGLLRGIQ
ncbi:MAG: ankyrin repeat domain-containing protein [Pseudomonadota bacterium]